MSPGTVFRFNAHGGQGQPQQNHQIGQRTSISSIPIGSSSIPPGGSGITRGSIPTPSSTSVTTGV